MTELAYERSLRSWVDARAMRWSRSRYSRRTGGEVVAYRIAPEGDPRGLVLIAHGAGNDALFSLPSLIKRFLERDLEVFTFDLDGHGRESTTRLSAGTIADAIPEALEQSGATARGLPVHAVGISLGGALVLHALGAQPGAFASASMLVAPLRVQLSRRAMLSELGPATWRTVWRERPHCGVWGLVPSFGPVKRDVYPLRLAERPPPGAFGYVEVLNRLLSGLELEAAAARTRTPSLLVYGGADRIVPSRQGRVLDDLLPASELLVLERETHLSTPLAPRAVARVLDWISAHGGGTAAEERRS